MGPGVDALVSDLQGPECTDLQGPTGHEQQHGLSYALALRFAFRFFGLALVAWYSQRAFPL